MVWTSSARAASQLAAARALLRREDPKAAQEARRKAEEALASFREQGDKDGELQAMQEAITAELAAKQPLEAVRMAKDKLFLFQQAEDKKGEAAMLVSLARAQLNGRDFALALQSGKKALAAYQKLQDPKGEFAAWCQAQLPILLALGEKKEALSAANAALALAKRLGGDEAKAAAAFAMMRARFASDSRDALAAANEALSLYKKMDDKSGEAATLVAMAEAHIAKKEAGPGLQAAQEALAVYRDLQNSKGTVAAMDLLVKAQILSDSPNAALETVAEQLELFKKAKDAEGEAAAYVTLFAAHRAQEDQEYHANEALDVATEALEMLRQTGNRKGEADIWLQVAQTHLEWNMQKEAMREAQEALMIYRDLKDKRGQDGANIVLTEVYIRRGEPALAPLHGEGLELLSKLALAVDERDGAAYQAANDRLMAIGGFGLLTETEQAAALTPVISRDPDAALEFMNANAPEGAELDQAKGPTGPQGVGSNIKSYTYWGFRSGGIAYGPRFRCVEFAGRMKGLVEPDEGQTIGLAVLDMQDASDDWEFSLKLHPAILDCALQSSSVLGDYCAPREKKKEKGKGK